MIDVPAIFRLSVKVLSASLIVGVVAGNAWGIEGDIDTSFGTAGSVITADTGTFVGFIKQADGKLVTASYSTNTLMRFNGDGSVDTSFDGDGVANFSSGTYAKGLIQLASGKLMLAGGCLSSISAAPAMLTRVNSDGSPDVGFDGDGKVTMAVSGDCAYFNTLAEQSDGKIIAAGSSGSMAGKKTLIARFNGDGTLDTSFNSTGKISSTFTLGLNFIDGFFKVLIQSDGKYLLGGLKGTSLLLARFNTDGTLDASFATAGKYTSSAPLTGTFTNLTLLADGKFLVTGSSNGDRLLARFNSNGTLDSAFGVNGMVTHDTGSTADVANEVVELASGKLLVAGTAFNGSNADAAIIIYNADGSLNTTFSGDGMSLFDNAGSTDSGKSVVVQDDAHVILASKAGNQTVLTRFQVNTASGAPGDSDGDGVADAFDAFPSDPGESADFDTDGIGDNADTDDDNDGVSDVAEAVAGTSSFNPDTDYDSISDGADAEPLTPAGLDISFNAPNGYVLGSNGSKANAVIRQADGKLVTAGSASNGVDFSITRYNSDGSLDAGFGSGGVVITDVGSTDIASTLLQQADGKLVAAGRSGSSLAIVRYNLDGSLDTSFDGDGICTTAFTMASAWINAGLQEQDGHLVFVGGVHALSNYVPQLIRLNSDGSTAKSLNPTAPADGEYFAVTQQVDGKLVAAGKAGDDTYVVRYNTDLTIDSGFGPVTVSASSGADAARSVAVQQDGKLVVAGYANSGPGNDTAVMRLNANGSLDTAFGSDGMLTLSVGVGADQANAIALENGDKIVIAGTSSNGSNTDGFVARITADGVLDSGLDGDGVITLHLGSAEAMNALALLSNGKAVVAGSRGMQSLVAQLPMTFNADSDGDGVLDASDNCTSTSNADQANLDGDQLGDLCDSDRDGDGVGNSAELVNGTNPDLADTDGDSVGDASDLFPMDAAESADNDSDGIGNNADTDDDNDGLSDNDEASAGTDPFVSDSDHDGILDGADAEPLTPAGLDIGFSAPNGYVLGSNGSKANAVVRQADGKLVTAGSANNGVDFYLSRYNSDGSLDTSFGSGGVVVTDLGSTDIANTLLQQADGKLVAAGRSGSSVAVVRYNVDGTLDASFDADGVRTIAYTMANAWINAGLQEQDGRLVFVGGVDPSLVPSTVQLIRLNSDGSTAKSLNPTAPANAEYFAVAQQADGKLVAAGKVANDTYVVRYNTDLTIDSSFGPATVSASAGVDVARGVAIQQDGKLVVAGYAHNGTDNDLALLRLNADGSLDTSFSGDGISILPVGGNADQALALALENGDRAVAAGVTHNGSDNDAFVARFNLSGGLDSTLSGGGVVTLNMGGAESANALALLPNGKAVIAGSRGAQPFLAQLLMTFNVDSDGDGVLDSADNCTTTSNADQANLDGDRLGDLCDSDRDGDGLSNAAEVVAGTNPDNADSDGDGVKDNLDAFPNNVAESADNDHDGTGNNADTDDDNDGLSDSAEAVAGSDPFDADSDNDGILDGSDTYPLVMSGLDQSFNAPQGYTLASMGSSDTAYAVIHQQDGKVVTAGSANNNQLALVRYNPDGSLDTGFGSGGKVVTSLGSRAAALLQQVDGKLVVAGRAGTSIAVARFNLDGSPDAGFDGDGYRSLSYPLSSSWVNAIVQESDGRLLLAGGVNASVAGNVPQLIRLNSDGSTALSLNPTSPAGGEYFALALQSDGKVLAAGKKGNDTYVVRYTTLLKLDTGFGSGGTVALSLSSGADQARGIVLQGDGKIVIAGYANNGTDNDIALARLNDNGGLDTSFGGGIIITPQGAGNDQANAIAWQHDGKLVVAGTINNGTNNDAIVLRYNSDGSLDTTLLGDGSVQIDTGAADSANAIDLDQFGRVLIAGASGTQFLTARLALDGDDDRDSIFNNMDLFTLDATEWSDSDNDGVGDNADPDDDNDGIPDAFDTYPYEANPVYPLDGNFAGSKVQEQTSKH